jgi:hypothetical protein
MGDFGIPGAPFVFSLPDDWELKYYGLPGQAPTYVAAVSPQHQAAVAYWKFTASSIDEILENSSISMPSSVSIIRFELNGMDCLLYSKEVVYYGEEASLWTYDIPPDVSGSMFPEMPSESPKADFSEIYVEYQGVVIRIDVLSKKNWDGASESAALLVLSGVSPGPPFMIPDEDPFAATTVSPTEAMRQHTSLPMKPLQHKGIRHEKISGKQINTQALRGHLMNAKPLTWCLNKVKEIRDALGRNREYGQYSHDLNTVYEILKDHWGPADDSESAAPQPAVKAHQSSSVTTPPPVGTTESETTCRKCGSLMQPSDKFCRECGSSRVPKSIRWSSRSET